MRFLVIKSETFLKSSKFLTLSPINEYLSKKGIIIFCIYDIFVTANLIIAEDSLIVINPQPSVDFIYSINFISLIFCITMKFKLTLNPNL